MTEDSEIVANKIMRLSLDSDIYDKYTFWLYKPRFWHKN
jgi:hypothetical protein